MGPHNAIIVRSGHPDNPTLVSFFFLLSSIQTQFISKSAGHWRISICFFVAFFFWVFIHSSPYMDGGGTRLHSICIVFVYMAFLNLCVGTILRKDVVTKSFDHLHSILDCFFWIVYFKHFKIFVLLIAPCQNSIFFRRTGQRIVLYISLSELSYF